MENQTPFQLMNSEQVHKQVGNIYITNLRVRQVQDHGRSGQFVHDLPMTSISSHRVGFSIDWKFAKYGCLLGAILVLGGITSSNFIMVPVGLLVGVIGCLLTYLSKSNSVSLYGVGGEKIEVNYKGDWKEGNELADNISIFVAQGKNLKFSNINSKSAA